MVNIQVILRGSGVERYELQTVQTDTVSLVDPR